MYAQQSSSPVVPTSSAGKDKHLTNSVLVEGRSIRDGDQDILQGEKVDEFLAAKMTLINDVGDSISLHYKWDMQLTRGPMSSTGH